MTSTSPGLIRPALTAMALASLTIVTAQPAAAASVTLSSAATCADAGAIGVVTWTNPTASQTGDDVRATASLGNREASHFLKCTGFGFSIPVGSTIQGITVEWEQKGAFNNTADNAVRIVKGGSVGAADRASASDWLPTDTLVPYGGASDLWGDTWTAADVNDSNFGAAISARSVDGNKTASIDSVQITITYLECGDGVTGGLEQCDEGVANGTTGSCCSSSCTFNPGGSTCRDSAGECDLSETCTGSSAACPADAKQAGGNSCSSDGNVCTLDQCDGSSNACLHPAGNEGVECRAATGVCDDAETCSGTDTSCPADAYVSAGTLCGDAGTDCTNQDTCDGSGSCTDNGFASNGTECGAGPSDCMAHDTCDGAGACQPNFEPGTTVCRPSAGACDVAESCTGDSAACPNDVKSAGVCRDALGVCDVAESCDGVSDDCPADLFEPATTTCREAAGDCDLVELCTGVDVECPADSKSTAVCRAAVDDCDVAESCDGESELCPQDEFAAAGVACPGTTPSCLENACDGHGGCAYQANSNPPQGALTLRLGADGLSWIGQPDASLGYDVVRGDLGVLLSSGGDFAAAIDGCLANDELSTSLLYSDMPETGNSYFFLMRGVNCVGSGSFLSGGSNESAPIGASPEDSPFACQ